MVDKINSSAPLQPRKLEAGGTRATQNTDAGNSQANSGVSSAARPESEVLVRSTFEQLQNKVAESSEIDQNKVASIKAAIERGEYTIDAQRIARAVVDLEQLLQA